MSRCVTEENEKIEVDFTKLQLSQCMGNSWHEFVINNSSYAEEMTHGHCVFM